MLYTIFIMKNCILNRCLNLSGSHYPVPSCFQDLVSVYKMFEMSSLQATLCRRLCSGRERTKRLLRRHFCSSVSQSWTTSCSHSTTYLWEWPIPADSTTPASTTWRYCTDSAYLQSRQKVLKTLDISQFQYAWLRICIYQQVSQAGYGRSIRSLSRSASISLNKLQSRQKV